MKKSISQRISALKPRNVLAVLARKRRGGAHTSRKRVADDDRKDLVQRLREAGL
jgi:hypothetical protein